MSAWSIDDYYIKSFFFEDIDSFLSNSNRVSLVVTPVKRDSYFGGILLELIKCSCPEGICADEAGSPTFALPVVRIFSAGSSLAWPL